MKRTLLATAAALLLVPTLAFAAADDQQFAMAASQGNELQIALGRLALGETHDPQVKDFAERMVQDHSKAQNELEQAAKQEGITLSDSLTEPYRTTLDRLAETSGKAFDRTYVQDMVEDHAEALRAYDENAAPPATPVERYAAHTRPLIRRHDELAKELEEQVIG